MSDDIRPVSMIDGKRNPAYTAWRSRHGFNQVVAARYSASPKGRANESRRYLERIEKHPLGTVACRGCRESIDLLDAINRGYNSRFALCDLCD